MPSYIYVASDGETSKIGMTNNPHFRMTKLRSATKSKYQALKLWQSEKDIAAKIEKEVTQYMSFHCIKGKEWFSVSGRVLIHAVDFVIARGQYFAVTCDMPFIFDLPSEFEDMACDIADIISQTPEEAIRYAIAFTHKQLTEVLNVEDLDHE
ncbi:MAG: GIY-YIG nuclease family protein [Geminicoccaceae bacterium]